MHLVTAGDNTQQEQGAEARVYGGVVGMVICGWRWWSARVLIRERRTAKRQLFLLETMVLGPKQRVVLMRCGSERFLVGMGAEGVTSVVRVEEAPPASGGALGETLPMASGGDGPWGG